MGVYPKRIGQAIARVELDPGEPDAAAVAASFECGCFVRFFLHIKQPIVERAAFRSNGCGYMIAAAQTLTELITNKSLRDLHGLDPAELAITIYEKLGDFPPERAQCAHVAIESLTKVFAEYRRRQIEEFTGEKALICTCFGVSEETIDKLIREKHLHNVEQVSAASNAGSGCGSCRMLILEMIDALRQPGDML